MNDLFKYLDKRITDIKTFYNDMIVTSLYNPDMRYYAGYISGMISEVKEVIFFYSNAQERLDSPRYEAYLLLLDYYDRSANRMYQEFLRNR